MNSLKRWYREIATRFGESIIEIYPNESIVEFLKRSEDPNEWYYPEN